MRTPGCPLDDDDGLSMTQMARPARVPSRAALGLVLAARLALRPLIPVARDGQRQRARAAPSPPIAGACPRAPGPATDHPPSSSRRRPRATPFAALLLTRARERHAVAADGVPRGAGLDEAATSSSRSRRSTTARACARATAHFGAARRYAFPLVAVAGAEEEELALSAAVDAPGAEPARGASPLRSRHAPRPRRRPRPRRAPVTLETALSAERVREGACRPERARARRAPRAAAARSSPSSASRAGCDRRRGPAPGAARRRDRLAGAARREPLLLRWAPGRGAARGARGARAIPGTYTGPASRARLVGASAPRRVGGRAVGGCRVASSA